MTKIQGLLRSTLILCLFLSVKVEKAEAFFLIPPLPPEPVVDFPDEGGKIVSVAQAAYQKVQSYSSKLATLQLDAIKKGDAFAIKNALSLVNALTEGGKKKSPNKSPNKDNIKGSQALNIEASEKGLLDEEAFFNAHNELFFTYPSLSDYQEMVDNGLNADYAFMQTVYKQKAAQYRQDVLIDTYLTARLMEDYLVTVERTLNRLDACQKNPKPNEENCTFFGMTMAEVDGTKTEAPDPNDKNNPGQMGAATNAYIVTMVYDRLMRLVEDLTATEALYQSAKQTDLADPVQPTAGSSSSAEDYLPAKYQFVYTEQHEHSYAKKLINEKGLSRSTCAPGEDGCPYKNEDGKAKKLMDDTEILTKLQPIDNLLTEAITIHNLKNQLPSYKVQYRKYLRAIENHKRALQAVYDSDQCIVNFFAKHAANKSQDWNSFWGVPNGSGSQPTEDGHVFDYEKDYNDYNGRGGLSKELIDDYQNLTQNIIIGTSGECEGYYKEGQCAEGYKSNTDQPCAENKTLFPCVLANAVEFDANTTSSIDTDNIGGSIDGGVESITVDGLSRDEKDYIASNSDLESIANDNRVRTETPWRIGAQKIIELTKGGMLKFNPWNDQKDLQTEYLRLKYHNIANIIKTTDKGWASFKIAQALSENPDTEENEEDLQNEIKAIIQGGQTCLSVGDATPKAAAEVCSSEYIRTSDTHYEKEVTYIDSDGEEATITLNCEATGNSSTGIITVTKETFDDINIATVKTQTTYDQYVSKSGPNCKFKEQQTSTFDITSPKGIKCNDTWDFTKGFLVKRYLRCAIDKEETSDGDKFYLNAFNKGRIVARNKLQEVLTRRIEAEETITALVRDYNTKVDALQIKLAQAKQEMTKLNGTADTATKEKNLIQKLKDKSERRIKSIDDEIRSIDERASKVNIGSDKCALGYRKAKLVHEKSCIENGVGNFVCPGECAGLKEAQQPEGCRDASKIPTCEDEDNGYLVSLYKAINAQKELDKINSINDKKGADEEPEVIPDSVRKANNKYIRPAEAIPALKNKDAEIEAAQTAKKDKQKEVDDYQTQINNIAEAFMSEDGKKWEEVKNNLENGVTKEQASYIVTSLTEQEAIEDENTEFERFLEADDKDTDNDKARMFNKNKEYCTKKIATVCIKHKSPKGIGSDNLATTLNEFFNGSDKDAIKTNMEEKWVNDVLKNLGNKKFTIDSSFIGLGLPAQEITMETIIEKIKEIIVEAAAKQMETNITTGDEVITAEMNADIAAVGTMATKYGINTEDSKPSEEQLKEIISHDNYIDWPSASALKIASDHHNLIAELRNPINDSILKKAGIDMAELYGIKENIENTYGETRKVPEKSDKYFAGLPARGYINAMHYATDDYAGKDYMSPNAPLMNLPPVREVFYFDAQDYEELPANPSDPTDAKKKREATVAIPSISHLLDKKFPEYNNAFVSDWEYMPEVWRYLLARPNRREDGLYQQTFIERSYDAEKIKEIVKGDDYGIVIAREGVYPCKLHGSVIDVSVGNNIEDISFVHLNTSLSVPDCKEIALNKIESLGGKIANENICNLYNKKKSGAYEFCHLMADHGKKDTRDTGSASSLGKINDYSKYSELGQFLEAEAKIKFKGFKATVTAPGNNLFYRDMQKSIADYLTNDDEEKTKNDITRQVAELSSFRRNILGSFLDTVYAEHSAKKTRDNMRKTVLSSLTGLCKQLHQNGKSVGGSADENDYKKFLEEQRNAIDEECAKYLTDGEGKVSGEYAVGLAFSKIGEKDTQYGVNEEFTKDQDLFGGINCSGKKASYYEDIFCKLDEIKAGKLKDAIKLRQEAQAIYEALIDKVGDKKYVEERFADIDDYIAMLETDENEVVFLTPNMKKGKKDDTASFIEGKVTEEKTNRTVERSTDEESITGMDNGTQVVPYCPNY